MQGQKGRIGEMNCVILENGYWTMNMRRRVAIGDDDEMGEGKGGGGMGRR